MKNKILLSLLLVSSMILHGQTIENISVSPSDIEGIDISLEVCHGYGIGYINHSDTVEESEINLTVCYHVSDAPITDCDFRVITVPINPEIENYTLNVEVYKSLLPTECDYSTLTDTLTQAVVLSNTENEIEEQIQVFPNPTNGLLNIEVNNNFQINSISLYNLIGTKILVINNPKNELDLSNLNSGIYLLEIRTDKGKVVERIVKK